MIERKCVHCASSFFMVKDTDLCLSCYSARKDTSEAKPARHNRHEEDDIQEAFFNSARTIFPSLDKRLFSVPNGGRRNKKEAVRLKRQGVTAGVSDIICLVPNDNYPFLCLETKTASGTQSKEQKQFQREVESAGGLYMIFRSAEEGINILKKYLQTAKYK